jgi:siderophore-iron reductase FhuF
MRIVLTNKSERMAFMPQTPDFTLAETFFNILPKGAKNPVFSASAAELLKPETMDELLEQGRAGLRGFGLDIAVSLVGLAFFNLPATVMAYMSLYGQVLDLSLNRLTVQLEIDGDRCYIVFKPDEVRWTELPGDGRDEAYARALKELLRGTVNPVVEMVAARGGFKPDLIWNQYGARMISILDYILQRVEDEASKETFRCDYERLLCGLPAETFNRGKNPYIHEPRYVESPYKPGDSIVIRSSCCMWYRRENGEKCYNCPLLTDEQREEKKLRILREREHSA